ncbi:MAG TPA: CoA pyrophosphatase [Candidatus Avacidaminococcus intestinavium]|uniref:CoA pyrophosphatase n=1 Tax=Candidatus Avacidaminococcus intestinavium TaxID=2840684 RepID=A0A9D1SM04_9FIRM|nr:CoA pyrophosphatase [Candidatus Avacidaminococcus intestinavium]
MADPEEMELLSRICALTKERTPSIDKMDILTEASVLLPLVKKDGKLTVLFEVRSRSLVWQPGDVCFPGGKVEKEDLSFEETAVRETCEELNLVRSDIHICGALDFLVTHLGPIVYPFVGFIEDYQKIRPSLAEVEEVFYVPLEQLLEQKPQQAKMQLANKASDDFPFDLVPGQPKEWIGRTKYPVYFYKYEDHVIWGMTARILYAFLEKIKNECLASGGQQINAAR